MPYSSMEEVPASLKGIKPPITLAQANLVAAWADRIAESDNPPDSPWAVAIAQFKKVYTVSDGKWVKKQASNLLHNKAVTSDLRRETMQGRQYLVVPVVAMPQGVLNGEYVDGPEIERSVDGWNGRPVVINHPQDEGGNDISANAPCVLGQSQIGQLFNARWEDARLKGEMWIDVALAGTTAGGRQALRRFERGEPTDVSTAYFRRLVDEPGVFNGNAYVGKAVDLMPDHLAILLDEKGACSWADGCGAPRTNADESLDQQVEKIRRAWIAEYESRDVPVSTGPWVTEVFEDFLVVESDGQYWRVPYTMQGETPQFAKRSEWKRVEQKRDWVPVQEGNMQTNVRSKARTPSYSGTSSADWSRPRLEDFGFEDVSSINDLSQAQRNKVASISLLGDAGADSFSEMTFFPVVNPKTGALNENALRAVLGGRGAQANIPSGARESARSVARRLLNKEFGAELTENAVQRVVKAVIRALSPNKEAHVNVEELLEAGAPFEREALEAMSEEQIAFLSHQAAPPEEPPATNDDDAPDWATAMDELRAEMASMKAELGANAEKERKELVGQLAANARCALSEKQLNGLDMATLRGIEQSLVDPDYRGSGGGRETDGGEIVVLKAPAVLLKKEA